MHVVRLIAVAVFLILVLPLPGGAAPVMVAKTDKCPVCGMFVAKYPDFLAQIIFADGSYVLFDGAKDMFKYYFNIKKYQASKDLSDIAFIYVTDYYSMTPIDGRTAWYVAGSDVFGPMGRELMPFVQEADAAEFIKDHSGKKLIRFDEVAPDLIQGLD
ncbi:MAG: nitrous oxide reductase accessory protein NosL [Desulfobacteraceae bacterium]|jgi:nitrous oxide reductase accessory protein NosL|nr:nitrous oxide reductase accessory protein NosL [Desulfobacteraceae bacterium]